MNIIKTEIPFIVEAKSTGSYEKKNRIITYHFLESAHTLCLDKVELLKAQLRACERLLMEPKEKEDKNIIQNEITKINLALKAIQG
jgi:hypothetical protein